MADRVPPPALPPPSDRPIHPPWWRDAHFRAGAQDFAAVAVGIAVWGLVTGAAMVDAIGTWPAVAMSVLVYAGSAQFAALPLMAADAPAWVVWAVALCVNLRFVIFSAQWRPYFSHLPRRQRMVASFFQADLNFAAFVRRWPQPQPGPAQVRYFWGGSLLGAAAWHVASLAGIVLGHAIPASWNLGFAGTLALLAMVWSMLAGERALWLPAAVAATAAVAAFALPFKLHIVVAIACAVAMGIATDRLRPPHVRSPGGAA